MPVVHTSVGYMTIGQRVNWAVRQLGREQLGRGQLGSEEQFFNYAISAVTNGKKWYEDIGVDLVLVDQIRHEVVVDLRPD